MGWVLLDQKSQVLAVHAALLHTGQILYFSGDEHDKGQHDRNMIDHTRVFHCATLGVKAVESPTTDVFCSGHAFLGDGRLLVAGGTEAFPLEVPGPHHPHFPGLRNTWAYDPATTTWIQLAAMNFEPGLTTGGGRWYPTLTTLTNGQIAAMSGHPSSTDSRHNNNSPESYSTSPSPSGAWSLLTSADPNHEMDYYPRLHVLPSGDIFCATPLYNGRTQRFSPTSRTWTDVCAAPPDPTYGGYTTTSVLLPLLPEDGYRARVLIAGAPQPFIIDLGATVPEWRPTSPRTIPGTPRRNNLNSVLLPTGEVFICGGVSDDNFDASAVKTAETYRPETDSWVTLESATVVRNYHSVALLMPDGRVWTAGSNINGSQSFPEPGIDNREPLLELYEPPYYSANRPVIISGPTKIGYGNRFEIKTTQTNQITRVVIIRNGSVTHAYNPDQRYIGLQFRRIGGNRLSVTAPPIGVAIPGYYMLFVINERSVPSVAKFIQIPGPCLIATAAFGSPQDKHVEFLRNFRDEVVVQSRLRGFFEKLLTVYYGFSPSVARRMDKNRAFRIAMKHGVVFPFLYAFRLIACAANRLGQTRKRQQIKSRHKRGADK